MSEEVKTPQQIRVERIDSALSKYQSDKAKECAEKGVPFSPNPTNLVQLIEARVDNEIAEEEKAKLAPKKVQKK